MKPFQRILVLIIASATLVSCEKEIEVNAEWEDITVVYGLLNPNTKTNYVRIERGWLGEAPARESFDKPDSLYYDTLHVSLHGVDQNGDTIYSDVLYKDESVQRDSGVFTTDDFHVYRTDKRLVSNLTNNQVAPNPIYYLSIEKPGTNFAPTKASTVLLEGSDESEPFSFGFREPREFVSQRPSYNGNISWYHSQGAFIYEIDILFRYKELDLATGEIEEKEFQIDFEQQEGPFAATTAPFDAKNGRTAFYQRIAGQVPVTPGVLRFYDQMRITLWAGGEEMLRYIQLNEPTSGLNQIKPEFEQIINGTGLFSSRATAVVDNVDLSSGTGGVKNTFYRDRILCDRNFAIVEGTDTCFCEFLGDEPIKECL